jgi:hypothetical protein
MPKNSKQPVKSLGGNELEQLIDRAEQLVYIWRKKAKQLQDGYRKRQK